MPLDFKGTGENKTLYQNSGKLSPQCQKAAELHIFLIVYELGGKNAGNAKNENSF